MVLPPGRNRCLYNTDTKGASRLSDDKIVKREHGAGRRLAKLDYLVIRPVGGQRHGGKADHGCGRAPREGFKPKPRKRAIASANCAQAYL